MTDFNYKKYSLEHLENWMHDAMSSADATPQEIYDVIVGVVKENYDHHKKYASDAYELLHKLNGCPTSFDWTAEDVLRERDYYENVAPSATQRDMDNTLTCDKDDQSPECKGAWNSFWEDVDKWSNDKVVKWVLPVQVDGLTGECYVNFPDDLLEAANLEEGDTVKWTSNDDGSFTLTKVTQPLGMDEC